MERIEGMYSLRLGEVVTVKCSLILCEFSILTLVPLMSPIRRRRTPVHYEKKIEKHF